MKKLLRSIRIEHMGFVIAVILLASGWIMRLISLFLTPGMGMPTLAFALTRLGLRASQLSVFFLFGGIIFYGLIGARRLKAEPQVTLTEQELFIPGPKGTTTVVRTYHDGLAMILFDEMPFENAQEQSYLDDFSNAIGTKVIREDRECLVIGDCNDQVLEKALAFLQQ